jgi:hypothetical protein
MAVALVDVDRFRQYNDAFGHPAGDAILRTVAGILGRSVRKVDLVARYGGEEFAVMLARADRPAALAAGPWRYYKMCVVTAFRERDADPRGGLTGSLADALAVAHAGAGGPSWCSNPMIELGHGNAASNCVGCHQHGGTALSSEAILADDTLFPDNGRTQLRNNFPDDYSWAVTAGDRLGRMFADQVEYWTPPPP